jgi:hypothetical protein
LPRAFAYAVRNWPLWSTVASPPGWTVDVKIAAAAPANAASGSAATLSQS